MVERDQEEESEERGAERLKITDRRLFTEDGKLRQDLPAEDEARDETPRAVEEPVESPPEPPSGAEGAGFEHRPVEEPEGVDFTMLINGMAQPALLFLGEIPHPGSGETTVDLEQARIQIDMLELLRVKCRGNLTPQEDGLIDRMLYQLRMLYVARSTRPQG